MSDGTVFLQWMAQRDIPLHDIAIPSTVALTDQESSFLKLPQDPLNRPFGNSDLGRDVSYPGIAISGDAEQDVAVIAEKSPPMGCFFSPKR